MKAIELRARMIRLSRKFAILRAAHRVGAPKKNLYNEGRKGEKKREKNKTKQNQQKCDLKRWKSGQVA